MVFPKGYTPDMERFKKYKKALLAGIVVLGVVGSGSYFYMQGKKMVPTESVKKVPTNLLEGQVIRQFEGENRIAYKMGIPDAATSSMGMDGALIKIVNEEAPFISMYFSYEGGRGYIASDYINNVIAPRVPGVKVVGTTTIGLYTWTVAESETSEWHVAQVGDGQWLLVVENRRVLHDDAVRALDTLTTQ